MPVHKSQQQEADAGNGVPLIPGWAQTWGVLLAFPAVIALLLIGQVGLVYGADDGWALLAAAAALIIAPWLFGYTRRREVGQARREQARYEQLGIEEVDVMTGRGFEGHCVKLLPARGYRNVIWTGGTKGGDQGGDITATAPDGAPVAVQCKRRKASIGPGVIRELVGAITSGMHKGRRGILMTNAEVTPGARAYAEDNGITVIDRAVLQQWMGQARKQIEQGRQHRMRPAGLITTGVLGAAAIVVSTVAFQVAASAPSAATARSSPSLVPARSSPASALAPSAVTRAFFAAISRHDWQDVWQLGGRNLGEGPYATYSGMISGYRFTARDVVTSLGASGESVSGRFLAYETTGPVQAYSFSYIVHDGVIASGHQVLLGTRSS